MNHETRELSEIVAATRALLEAEQELGADGIARARSANLSASSTPLGEMQRRPAISSKEKLAQLEALAKEAARCQACALWQGRNQSVFARGNPDAELVFVGEGPGRDEDQQGMPFVGQAGQLLDRMIAAMHFGRDEVYICNVVKCRPPENRTPAMDEVSACERFLVAQLELVAPKVVVALGKSAAQTLGISIESAQWRGKWHQWRAIPIMATYHPAFLLRSPQYKRVVWEDLQEVMARLGKK
jgi:DNA polymerase